MYDQNQSPCRNCARVPHPQNCENKRCVPWQHWFLQRWALIHEKYRLLSKEGGNNRELEK